jgi:predicted DNA-binding transcriptional regulator YafY
MHRNRELIRQWTLLQAMARSRDSTIPRLAADLKVSTRTIRRDLNALQEAGFPIYDDDTDGGSKAWRLETKSLGALARSGLSFSELCALYYSRALIECFAGTHVLADVQSALDKFEAALSPQMKKFLDRLPGVVTAKPRGAKRHDATTYGVIAKLLEAILHQRVVGSRTLRLLDSSAHRRLWPASSSWTLSVGSTNYTSKRQACRPKSERLSASCAVGCGHGSR